MCIYEFVKKYIHVQSDVGLIITGERHAYAAHINYIEILNQELELI